MATQQSVSPRPSRQLLDHRLLVPMLLVSSSRRDGHCADARGQASMPGRQQAPGRDASGRSAVRWPDLCGIRAEGTTGWCACTLVGAAVCGHLDDARPAWLLPCAAGAERPRLRGQPGSAGRHIARLLRLARALPTAWPNNLVWPAQLHTWRSKLRCAAEGWRVQPQTCLTSPSGGIT